MLVTTLSCDLAFLGPSNPIQFHVAVQPMHPFEAPAVTASAVHAKGI